ncbi:MAG: type II secretion system protein GspK [bacterium]
MAALWLVVLVGITGYELSVRSRTRRVAVANALESVQARAAAEAGLETARAELDRRLRMPLEARTRFRIDAEVDPLGDLAFMKDDTIVLGDARVAIKVRDAGAQLQVNRASEDDLRRFLVALPLDANVADLLVQRIMDWRDADSFRRARGAERDDYLRAGARALPTNAPFRSVDELRDVDGITSEVYARMASMLSVNGPGQVNVNTAPLAVLRSLPGIGDEAANVLVRARQYGHPIRSLPELSLRLSSAARQALADATSDLNGRVIFETSQVSVETVGWVSGSPVRVAGVAIYQRSGDLLGTVLRRVGQ